MIGMDQSDHRQSVDRLEAVDGVAAGDGNSGHRTRRRPAGQDFADGRGGQFVHRHADDGEGEDRLASHGVDVRESVGRGDAAEVEGIIDDRHEEVGGRHHRLLGVEPPDGGVVAGFSPDQQIGERPRRRRVSQDLGEHGGRELAAAAAAVGQGGQWR